MAKKDKKGFRIPKEIGGVKVPKEARRAGEALIEKASSPAGRQMLASGLAMAATAAAAVAARQARDHGPASNANAAGESGTASVDPSRVADALGDAASAFMTSLFARSAK
ncbi:hypothetical protein [Sphingomonas jeddahensis]|uniref:Uncharacterized protein n=1 Tax=Sphingomonas jeddahensis TaxID=1915074 RepID=A0A1V2ETE8_9SPHN|nr:hypothetical protein [Sphingomonas jeddahensis]ONF95962.1 hypothetical protein SPHI_18890 [Sphingomonas jeddahensis]